MSFSDLEPGFSRDTRTPAKHFQEIVTTAGRLNIPARVWILHKWDESPLLEFRKAPPAPVAASDTSYLVWVGNVPATFEGLKLSVSAGVNLSRTGIPFWGHDIGGYLVNGERGLMGDELFIRWTQYAALTPVMRVHGRQYPNDPWRFENPEVVETFRDYSWLHKNLRPYFISELIRSSRDRRPVILPISTASSDMPQTHESYMCGRSILVSPVTTARAATKSVSLPAGRWWDFWTEEVVQDPLVISNHPAPRGIIPIFIQAGSVIPMELDASLSPMAVMNDTPHWILRFFPDSGAAVATIFAPERIDVTMKSERSGRRVITINGIKDMLRSCMLEIHGIDSSPVRVTKNGKIIQKYRNVEELVVNKEGWSHLDSRNCLFVSLQPGKRLRVEF